MKAKLPIIGQVRTGKDTVVEPEIIEKTVEKVSGLGAGFLDLKSNALTTDKTVSSKLTNSFYGWVYANVSVLAE